MPEFHRAVVQGRTAQFWRLHGNFCSKPDHDVKVLVAGPGIFVCDECVALAGTVIEETEAKSSGSRMSPEATEKKMQSYYSFLEGQEPEKLLEGLVNVERTRKGIYKHQQVVVDILRAKRFRWAEIGDALGVSRQAAWQRFGASD